MKGTPFSVNFRGMREEVAQYLRGQIFEQVFHPGQQIYEADLAKSLNLSRGPIREALLQLENESFVRNIYNKGWFVIKLEPWEISQIISLRAYLEVVALSLAEKNSGRRALSRLEKIQTDMLLAFNEERITDAIQRDFDFHKSIWAMSKHSLLADTLNRITSPYFAFYKMAGPRSDAELKALRRGFDNHHAMIDYLSGESSNSAEWCIRNHFSPYSIKWNTLLDEFPQGNGDAP